MNRSPASAGYPPAACHAGRAFQRRPISLSNLNSQETGGRETRSGAHHLPSFSFLLHVRGAWQGLLIAKFMGLIPGPARCGPARLALSVSRCLCFESTSPGARVRAGKDNLSLPFLLFSSLFLCAHIYRIITKKRHIFQPCPFTHSFNIFLLSTRLPVEEACSNQGL